MAQEVWFSPLKVITSSAGLEFKNSLQNKKIGGWRGFWCIFDMEAYITLYH